MFWAWFVTTLAVSTKWAQRTGRATIITIQDWSGLTISTTSSIPTPLAWIPVFGDGNSSSFLYWNFHSTHLEKEITHVTVEVIDTVEIPVTKPAIFPTALFLKTAVYYRPQYPIPTPTSTQPISTKQPSVTFAFTKDEFLRSKSPAQTSQLILPPLTHSQYPDRRARRESRLSTNLAQLPSFGFKPSLAYAAETPFVFPLLFAAFCLASCTWTLQTWCQRLKRRNIGVLQDQETARANHVETEVELFRQRLGDLEAEQKDHAVRAVKAEREIESRKSIVAQYQKAVIALRIMFAWVNKERIGKDGIIEQLQKQKKVDNSVIKVKDSALDEKKKHVKALEEKVVILQDEVYSQQDTINLNAKDAKDHVSSTRVEDLQRQLKAANEANLKKEKQILRLEGNLVESRAKQKTHDNELKKQREAYRTQGKAWNNERESIAQLKQSNEALKQADKASQGFLAKQKGELINKDSTILELTDELNSTTAISESHSKIVANKEIELAKLQNNLGARTAEVHDLNLQLARRDVRIKAMETKSFEDSQKLKIDIEDRAKTIEAQATTIKQKDDVLVQLQGAAEARDTSEARLRAEKVSHQLMVCRHNNEKAKTERLEEDRVELQAKLAETETELDQAKTTIVRLEQEARELMHNFAVTGGTVQTTEQGTQTQEPESPLPLQAELEPQTWFPISDSGPEPVEEIPQTVEDYDSLFDSYASTEPMPESALTVEDDNTPFDSEANTESEQESPQTVENNGELFTSEASSEPEQEVYETGPEPDQIEPESAQTREHHDTLFGGNASEHRFPVICLPAQDAFLDACNPLSSDQLDRLSVEPVPPPELIEINAMERSLYSENRGVFKLQKAHIPYAEARANRLVTASHPSPRVIRWQTPPVNALEFAMGQRVGWTASKVGKVIRFVQLSATQKDDPPSVKDAPKLGYPYFDIPRNT